MSAVKHSILMVGGGIGGLAAALACAQKGAKPLLIERTAQFSEVGAGVQLGPNVTRTLFAWGLESALQNVVSHPEHLLVRDSQSGQSLGNLRLGPRSLSLYGAPYVTVHRADLHRVLLDHLVSSGAAELKLNCEIDLLRDDDEALVIHGRNLSSGQFETMSAEALVGADGLWSAARQYVIPPEQPRSTGLIAYRALMAMKSLPEKRRSQDVTIWLGSHMHAVMYPVKGGQFLNLVVIVHGHPPESLDSWDHSANKQDLIRTLGPVHAEFIEVLEAVPAWRLWPICDRPPLKGPHQMAKGRIALLGDAAHPMRPFLAQGAGMAIEDAAALANCWANLEVPLPQRWQQYARMRWARNARVQQRAIRNGHIFHLQGPLKWGRDVVMRCLGESLIDLPWLYGGP